MSPRPIQAFAAAAGGALALICGPASAEDAPVRVSAQGVVDGWRTLQGGLRAGSAGLAEAEARLDIDADRALGWRGVAVSVSAMAASGRGPSARLTGDSQTADNKDATPGARLYEAWIRKAFGGGYLKAGVVDLNSEFNLAAAPAVFVNGAQGLGLDLGQVGASGPSVYPAPRLGALAAFEGPATLKLAVFDGLTQTGGPRRQQASSEEHGALALAEASRVTSDGGRIALGLWRRSANFGGVLEPIRRHPSSGAYLLTETRLWRGPRRSLDGYVRIGAADPRTEQVARHLTADLVLNQPFLRQDGEAIGLGVVRAELGDHALRMRAATGQASRRAETAVELFYRTPVAAGVWLQPDLQYIAGPGFVQGRRDAVLVGLRLSFAAALAR